jgi:hypothetical protein
MIATVDKKLVIMTISVLPFHAPFRFAQQYRGQSQDREDLGGRRSWPFVLRTACALRCRPESGFRSGHMPLLAPCQSGATQQ